MMIKPILSNIAWSELNLMKYGIFGFLTINRKIIRNKINPPKGINCCRNITGNAGIMSHFINGKSINKYLPKLIAPLHGII